MLARVLAAGRIARAVARSWPPPAAWLPRGGAAAAAAAAPSALAWLLRGGAAGAVRAPWAAAAWRQPPAPPLACALAGVPAGWAAGSSARAPAAAAWAPPAWAEALWRAVPKRKPSYSVKRQRQMNPAQANDRELLHAYPCPKCDRGYVKLRHHLCPCDAAALNCKAVVRVRFGVRRRRTPTAAQAREGAPAAGGAD